MQTAFDSGNLTRATTAICHIAFLANRKFHGAEVLGRNLILNSMTPNLRRTIGYLWAIATGLAIAGSPVAAQEYPRKPIRFVVPLAAASTGDILARLVTEKLSKNIGQPVLIENRPGAGGNIGAEFVAKSAPDGYTLVLGTIATHAINPSLFKALPFDPEMDFTPITLLASAPNVLVLHPSVPAESVKGLVSLARSKPSQFTFSSGGNGNSQHLAGELFSALAGLKLVHVPYKGAPQAVTAVVSGEVTLMFPNIPLALPFSKSGRLKCIGVSTAERLTWWPEMPSISETIKGFEVLPWFGVMGPARLPDPLVRRLHDEFLRAIESPDIRENLVKQGFEIRTSSPDAMRVFAHAERAKWARVVKASGAKVD